MNVDLVTLIRIGGVLHFGILIGSFLTPQTLDWRSELRKLQPISRQLVWVHGAYIVLTIIAFGLILTTQAPALADASGLARAVCLFVALFWGIRLLIQFFYFAPGELLNRVYLKVGYHGLTVVFTYLTAVFTYAAVRGG
jgi:hypothetical protein